MNDGGQGLVALLGIPPDRRLLEEDLANLPDAEQLRQPPVAISTKHNRLVAAGSVMTGATLIGGVALALFGGWELLFQSGGVFAAVLALVGILLRELTGGGCTSRNTSASQSTAATNVRGTNAGGTGSRASSRTLASA